MSDRSLLEEPSSSGLRPGWTRARVIFLVASGFGLALALIGTRNVLLPFVIALIIAYVLTPFVALFEKVRVPRPFAILLVYAATATCIYLFVSMTASRVYDEAVRLGHDAPLLARELSAKWGPRTEHWVQGLLNQVEQPAPGATGEQAPALEVTPNPDGSYSVRVRSGFEVQETEPKRFQIVPLEDRGPEKFSISALFGEGVTSTAGYLKRHAVELIRVGQIIVQAVARGIFLTFMTLMVAAYLMQTRDDILDFLRSLPPPRARLGFERLLARMDRGLAGVVRGQLIICLINGALSAIGFWMFGLRYWPILAIICGVMSIIPIFGSILSTIPAILVGLTQDFWTALWVLLWVVGIHQIESNLLNPKIIGASAKIHPVLVVFALFVGEHYFGLWGAFLAVPALSVVQSVFQHFRYESMPDAGPDSLRPPTAVRSPTVSPRPPAA
jgi:predicted PurR-regulated permease PerM